MACALVKPGETVEERINYALKVCSRPQINNPATCDEYFSVVCRLGVSWLEMRMLLL